ISVAPRLILYSPEVFGRRREYLGAVGSYQQRDFDTDSAEALEVNPRLGGHHAARLEPRFFATPQARRLVDLQPHAVPRTMRKVLCDPATLDRPARRRVHVERPDAVRQRLDRALLTFQYGAVETRHAAAWLSDVEGPCHVRRITREYSTNVQDNQFVSRQRLGRRAGVRQRGALARRHDGLESRSFRPLELHAVFDLRRELGLSHAGPDLAQDFIEYRRGEAARLADSVDLSQVLDRAQFLDQPARWLEAQSPSALVLKFSKLAAGKVRVLVAHAGRPLPLEPAGDGLEQPPSLFPDLHASGGLPRSEEHTSELQ